MAMLRPVLALVVIISSCVSFSVLAAKLRDDVVEINANSLLISKDHSMHYSGDVVIKFQNYIARTQQVVVNFADTFGAKGKKKIQSIIINSPIVVVDLLDPTNKLSAQSGHYFAKNKALQLNGDVKVHKDGNLVVTQTLVIDL